MRETREDYGQHRWFIFGDSVIGGKISTTWMNGFITHGYTIFPDKKADDGEEYVIDVRHKDTFFDKDTATKELFKRKLRGEN